MNFTLSTAGIREPTCLRAARKQEARVPQVRGPGVSHTGCSPVRERAGVRGQCVTLP